MEAWACPACRNQNTAHLGTLPARNGAILLRVPGHLYRCPECELLFRRPYPSASELVQAYERLGPNRWNRPSKKRPDYAMASRAIRSAVATGRVLDVGCYRGDFLALLPDTYEKFGLEPAQSAREIAQQRGIAILASSIEELRAGQPMFHVITLLDVIEHLPYPLTSLQRLIQMLMPEGIFILSTGNSDALPWRLQPQDYWYYRGEHVSFLNPSWMQWAGGRLGLRVISVEKFSHTGGSILEAGRQIARWLAFWTMQYAQRYPAAWKILSLVYPFSKAAEWSLAPKTSAWHDHMLVVLRPA